MRWASLASLVSVVVATVRPRTRMALRRGLHRALALAGVLLALAPSAAAADHGAPARQVVMQLEYELGPGTDHCPSEEMLHEEVARRIGYNPFARGAKGVPAGRVRTVIARAAQGLTATYEYTDAAGTHQWKRMYSVKGSSRRSCEGAIEGVAVELAVELTVGDLPPPPVPHPPAALPTAGASPAPPPPATVPPPVTPPTPAPPPPGLLRPRFEVGASSFVPWGTAPGFTVGFALHAGAVILSSDVGRFSLAVEGRIDTPATDMRGVRTQLFAFSPLACGHRDLGRTPKVMWGFLGCVLGTVGALRGSWPQVGGSLSDRPSLYAAVGVRLALEAWVASIVALRAQLEALPTLHAAHVPVPGDSEPPGTSGLAGNAGLAVVFPF